MKLFINIRKNIIKILIVSFIFIFTFISCSDEEDQPIIPYKTIKSKFGVTDSFFIFKIKYLSSANKDSLNFTIYQFQYKNYKTMKQRGKRLVVLENDSINNLSIFHIFTAEEFFDDLYLEKDITIYDKLISDFSIKNDSIIYIAYKNIIGILNTNLDSVVKALYINSNFNIQKINQINDSTIISISNDTNNTWYIHAFKVINDSIIQTVDSTSLITSSPLLFKYPIIIYNSPTDTTYKIGKIILNDSIKVEYQTIYSKNTLNAKVFIGDILSDSILYLDGDNINLLSNNIISTILDDSSIVYPFFLTNDYIVYQKNLAQNYSIIFYDPNYKKVVYTFQIPYKIYDTEILEDY